MEGDVHIAILVFADTTQWHRNVCQQRALPHILGILLRTLQSPYLPATAGESGDDDTMDEGVGQHVPKDDGSFEGAGVVIPKT